MEHRRDHGCPPRAQREAGGSRGVLSPIVLELDPRLRGDDSAEVRHFTLYPRLMARRHYPLSSVSAKILRPTSSQKE